MSRIVRRSLVLVGMIAIACESSPSRPNPAQTPPTLYVADNPSCGANGCGMLEVRAFVWSFPVPQPPWGYMVIGEVHSTSGCLRFPDSWTLRVTGPSDTTILEWAPDSALFVVAIDSAAFHGAESGSLLMTIRGMTNTFTPGDARGWSVTFPGASDPKATATPMEPCRPES